MFMSGSNGFGSMGSMVRKVGRAEVHHGMTTTTMEFLYPLLRPLVLAHALLRIPIATAFWMDLVWFAFFDTA
jgi:hypothetical protein